MIRTTWPVFLLGFLLVAGLLWTGRVGVAIVAATMTSAIAADTYSRTRRDDEA